MKRPAESSCSWIAFTCATGSLLLGVTMLAFWHLDPGFMLTIAPGRPPMVPNSAWASVLAAIGLFTLVRGGRRAGAPRLLVPVGLLLVVLGGSALAETLLHLACPLNHVYFDTFLPHLRALASQLEPPCPLSGAAFLLLGVAFCAWYRRFPLTQLLAFAVIGIAALVLLGYFYDAPFLYHVTGAPLAGMSMHTATSLVLLSAGLLVTRPGEGVMRLALGASPAGAVAARFGLGALAALTAFGMGGLFGFHLYPTHMPAVRVAITLAFAAGLALVVLSSARAVDRIDRERRRALAELEESREQLLFAQHLAKVGYWHWNLLTGKIHGSEELFRQLGLEGPGPATFEDFLRVVHPDDRRSVSETAFGSIAGRCLFRIDFRVLRADGDTAYFHSTGSVEHDEQGLPWRLRGATHDVTETRLNELAASRASERVRILLEKANEAVRVREDVLSIVSHDLKNPLTSANLGVQILLRQVAKLPEGGGLLRSAQNVQRSIENMKMLVQGILDIGKIQSGTFAIEPGVVDTARLLRALDDVMLPIARDRRIDLTVREAPGCPRVRGDWGRLLQVLLNLTGNALKFTGAGGRVKVTCESDAHRQVIFRVDDDGPGIPAANLARIFERNWQAPATASGGNGLGLFIAKGIVEAHGGHIWVESTPGAGSRFFFSVPELPAGLEGVLDRQAGEGVESPDFHVGGRRVHVAESEAVTPLKLEREVLGEVDLDPQAGHA